MCSDGRADIDVDAALTVHCMMVRSGAWPDDLRTSRPSNLFPALDNPASPKGVERAGAWGGPERAAPHDLSWVKEDV
jgi:hypothetical protein